MALTCVLPSLGPYLHSSMTCIEGKGCIMHDERAGGGLPHQRSSDAAPYAWSVFAGTDTALIAAEPPSTDPTFCYLRKISHGAPRSCAVSGDATDLACIYK